MNFKVPSLLGSLAIITAGVISNVNPAQAVDLAISGTVDLVPLPPSAGVPNGFDFDTFDPNPPNENGFGEFVINSGSNLFERFDPLPFLIGYVKDLPPFPTPGTGGTPAGDVVNFLSFATDPGAESASDFDSFFDLDVIDTPPILVNTSQGVTASFSVTGAFRVFDPISSTTLVLPGQGTYSADITGFTVDSLLATLAAGNTVENVAYSADFIVEAPVVPEPASVVGLMALGLAGVTLRKRNQKS